jgi:hypothetical protein
MDPSGEEIRTIFITGFPLDVKEREINLLFRKYPGYEGGFLKMSSTKPMAFVTFTDQISALNALNDVQGLLFDPSLPDSQLQSTLAKHNTKSKRAGTATSDFPTIGSDPKRRAVQSPINSQYSFPTYLTGYTSTYPTGYPNASSLHATADNSINTIFINNIDEQGGEALLRDHIKMYPGFVRLKLGKTGRTAFAEFASHEAAGQAVVSLNGARISGSFNDLRVEFAKSNTKA